MATQDEPLRIDETQKRLLDWTYQQAPSERLAAQILDAEGYKDIDPSHPLGGRDDGRDGECNRNGEKGVWAVYFARGQKSLNDIETKLKADINAALRHNPQFLAFVTNQELRLAERNDLRALGHGKVRIDLFHMERIATVLDRPRMASVREQFLKIPSTARPPIAIRAEVLGMARAFINDEPVLQFFVDRHEKGIRTKSDKAWERVRAEAEARALEEAEKKRRAAAEEAARRVSMRNPLDLGFTVPWPDIESIMPRYPQLETRRWIDQLARSSGYGAGAEPEESEPLTDEQIDQLVAGYRAQLQARWPECKRYLASTAWPGLVIRLHNEGGYLSRVQVVMTFQGTRGVDHEDIDNFEFRKVENPNWQPQVSGPPWMSAAILPPSLTIPTRSGNDPVEIQHNDDGDLVVTITLPELRPRQVWQSYDDDFVLVLRHQDLEEVEVTYYSTAAEYHEAVDGLPITVVTERVPMFDSFRAAVAAVHKVP